MFSCTLPIVFARFEPELEYVAELPSIRFHADRFIGSLVVSWALAEGLSDVARRSGDCEGTGIRTHLNYLEIFVFS